MDMKKHQSNNDVSGVNLSNLDLLGHGLAV